MVSNQDQRETHIRETLPVAGNPLQDILGGDEFWFCLCVQVCAGTHECIGVCTHACACGRQKVLMPARQVLCPLSDLPSHFWF